MQIDIDIPPTIKTKTRTVAIRRFAGVRST